MDHVRDNPIPDPSPTNLIPIATLVEKQIASNKPEFLCRCPFDGDGLHFRQIDAASLNVGNAQIRNGDGISRLSLLVDRCAANNFANLT